MSVFGVSLSDRLKAAVNQLEATGTSLQQRALSPNASGPNGPGSPKEGGISRSVSPNIAKSPVTQSPISSPVVEKGNPAAFASGSGSTTVNTQATPTKTSSPSTLTSPTAGGVYAHPGQLAENALSGLRKSFHFGRSSGEFTRSPSTAALASPTGQQELKDIVSPLSPSMSTTTAVAGPSSPVPRLLVAGSSSPRSKSPSRRSPNTSNLAKLPTQALPPPDPSDPATYPLPPSPDLSPADSLVASQPSAQLYADPLGASPLLEARVDGEVPKLGLQEATPDTESKESALGLGMKGVKTEAPEDGSKDTSKLEENGTVDVQAENGDAPEAKEESLADVQRRYDDLSSRFTTLLAQTHSANRVLRELTPLEGGVADHEALEGWVRMMNGKVGMITEEMKRLQDKLTLQDSRMDELRDTHRLEASSQQELISKLRTDLSEAQKKADHASDDQATVTQLRADLTKAQTQAKEEEEKRTKAISLLKTVRMKLVKAEKEKEEVEKDRAEERAERSRASEEVERVKAEREREVNSLRKGFERELAGVKERYEKDLQTKKAAWELEMITTKATHAKELSSKTTKVNGLEAIVKELNANKGKQFDALQAKQAEAESARAEMEAMQTRTKELEFQLREANERCALLEDSLREQSSSSGRAGLGSGVPAGGAPSMGMSRSSSYGTSTSTAEVQRLLAEAEAKSEAKLSDLRFKIRSLEAERNEAEEEWATKLQERVRDLERLRRQVQEKEMEYAETLRGMKEKDGRVGEVEERARGLEREMMLLRTKVEEARGDASVAAEAERAARDEVSSFQIQLSTLQTQLDEAKYHSTHLRNVNKTLRDEMRKLQSSVQLMEKTRNPGVGYWSATPPSSSAAAGVAARSGVISPGPGTPTMETFGGAGVGEPRKSLESTTESARTQATAARGARGDSPALSASASVSVSDRNNDEEEVNLEYLRNVILQFLEHKQMRPNLVQVLSVILRFTPQELRRLNAKLLT